MPSKVERTQTGKDTAKAVIRFIEKLRVPSGYGQGGLFKLMEWQKQFIKDIYEPTTPEGKRVVRRAILSIARKNGKGLALDTPIPTPRGWATMGALAAGDEVFDERGQVCRVTFKSPVHIGLRCWRLKFADGSEIIADEQHQWLTTHKHRPWHGLGYNRRPITAVVTTPQIAESLLIPRAAATVERNHKVQVAGAIDCPEAALPIPPYVLGYWLGDGDSDDASITVGLADAEAILEVERELGFALTRRAVGDKAPHFGMSRGRGGVRAETVQGRLRALGLLGNKHIPGTYLWASREQRLALLQGLMDSDGSVSGNPNSPRCYFDNTNRRLAGDALTLVRSLGFKASLREDRATIKGRDIGPAYSVHFTAFREDKVFRLARKVQALAPGSGRRRRGSSNAIVACDEVSSVPTQCIQVDSPSHLFLAGHGFTPTHNTALIAGIALAHLVSKELAIQNGEIYSAANDRDQAAIVFKFAKQIVDLSWELREAVEIIASTKTMIGRRTGSIYRAISAEAGTKHGLSASVVIFDELAQSRGRELYDVLDTSFGSREEPLFIAISTQSNDPEHIFSKLVDDGLSAADPSIICHLFAADEECELDDEAQWAKANPALGVFRDREDLRTAMVKAMRMPAEEPKVRNLFLNQRVSLSSPLISRAEWQGCVGDATIREQEDVYLGLDLSSVNDLTALVVVTDAEPIRVEPFFWKPRETIEEQSHRDFGAGNYRYLEWADDNHLRLSPGKTIDPSLIALMIGELKQRYRIRGVAYDRWGMQDLRREFDRIGLQTYEDGEKYGSGLRLVAFGQGYKEMGPAVNAFERAILDGKLVHSSNPVLNWNATNAVATRDPAGNRKIDKEKARFRIDGMVALVMALGLRNRDRAGVPAFDPYALIG